MPCSRRSPAMPTKTTGPSRPSRASEGQTRAARVSGQVVEACANAAQAGGQHREHATCHVTTVPLCLIHPSPVAGQVFVRWSSRTVVVTMPGVASAGQT